MERLGHQEAGWTVVAMATLLGASHKAVAWLLSLAHLAQSKALVYDRQATANPKLPLAVLARIHLTFNAFFESVQGGGPVLLPDLSTLIQKLHEQHLICLCLPPAMQGLLGGCPRQSRRRGLGDPELHCRCQFQPRVPAPDWPRAQPGIMHLDRCIFRRSYSSRQ